MIRHALGITVVATACSPPAPPAHPSAASAPLSLAKDAQMIAIPAGRFIAGSTPEERGAAYDDFQHTAGHDGARTNEWFEGEDERHVSATEAYRIDLLPVTQAEYAEFVHAGQAEPPAIDERLWKASGFVQDWAQATRFLWEDGLPPAGREDHPAVLVTWAEAAAYCKWRGEIAGQERRLPSELEFEKAARGDQGIAYPWGNAFEPDKLNSAVNGPRDTTPVGQFVDGASPFGMLEAAGNVFQWTSTPFKAGHMTVKGSSWDDFAGFGRGAARHGRPADARHIIVGFRCAAPAA